MIKSLIFILPLLMLLGCKEKTTKTTATKNSTESIVDFVLEHKDNTVIELPNLYDSLVTNIPDDSVETLILAEILKKKGFKVINWGRGNFMNGPRIVNFTLQKENCFCVVSKMYYSTASDTLFQMAERINCIDSSVRFSKSEKSPF